MTQYNKDHPDTIKEMFNSIARNYDKTNAILSLQMHRRWNQTLIQKILLENQPGSILDLCCGTGAIAFEYLKQIEKKPTHRSPKKIHMLDFSKEMLACAQQKAKTEKLNHYDITYHQADAQYIPLPDHSIEAATVAYGIRNIKNPELCLKDVYRVLKKDGCFGILELTQPTHPLMRFGHNIYLRTVLPFAGKLLTSNQKAYHYLCNSIHSFIQPQTLAALMGSAGFKEIQRTSLMGGIATILIGRK